MENKQTYYVVINEQVRNDEFTHLRALTLNEIERLYPAGSFCDDDADGAPIKSWASKLEGLDSVSAADEEGMIIAIGRTREAAALALVYSMSECSMTKLNDWK